MSSRWSDADQAWMVDGFTAADFEAAQKPRGGARWSVSGRLVGAGASACAFFASVEVLGYVWSSAGLGSSSVGVLGAAAIVAALALGGGVAFVGSVLADWERGRRQRSLRAERGVNALSWDHPWGADGEERETRNRFRAGLPRWGVVTSLLLLHPLVIGLGRVMPWIVPLLLAAPVTALAWLVWRAAGDGPTRLTYLEFPYSVSRPVTLRFGLDARSTPYTRLEFTLRCIREEPREGFRPFGDARCKLVWIVTRRSGPELRLPDAGSDVDVTFELPPGLPGTRLSDVYPTYWELQVEGRSGAGPYDERFLVPIYAADVNVADMNAGDVA